MKTKAKGVFKNLLTYIILISFVLVFIIAILKLANVNIVTYASSKSTAQAWDGNSNLTSGEYYLNGDVVLNKKITIVQLATVVLALNGYSLTRGSGAASIEVENGATLTVQESVAGVMAGDSSNSNTILDSTNIDTAFLLVNGGSCIIKEVTIAANSHFLNANLNAQLDATINGQVTLQNTIGSFTAPIKLNNKISILNKSKITFLQENARKKIIFGEGCSIFIKSADCNINNMSSGRITAPSISLQGDENTFTANNVIVEQFVFDGLNKSNIIANNTTFSSKVHFLGNENIFQLSSVTFAADIVFDGENCSFIFTSVSNGNTATTIQTNKIKELNVNNCQLDILNLKNIQTITKLVYREKGLLSQVKNVVIEAFIFTEATVTFDGQYLNSVDYSTVTIKELIFMQTTTATLYNNSVIKDSKIYFVVDPNASTAIHALKTTYKITIHYQIDNLVKIAKGFQFYFEQSGSLTNIAFIGGATSNDYKEYFDSGKMSYAQTTTPEEPKQSLNKANLTITAAIVIFVVVANMLFMWWLIVFVLKKNIKK